MPKLQLICVTCGFIGYVDSLLQADDSGWKPAPSGAPGDLECPACRTDARRRAEARTKAAGRNEGGRPK